MDKKPQDTPSRHADKYVVRFPDGMRERIATSADANNRSINSEIIDRLERSFETPEEKAGAPDPQTIKVLHDLIDQQRTSMVLAFLLQELVDLLETRLPDDLRQNGEFNSLIDRAENALYDVKKALRPYGWQP